MNWPDAAPLYAVVDRRADGRRRIVAEYRDPLDARTHADALRLAGDPAEVVLLSVTPDGRHALE